MSEYRFDQIAFVSTEKKKPTEADKENYIGLEHLSPDTFDVVDYGSEVAPKGEKLVMRKGDVLFGKRRAYQKKVGIAPCDGIFSAHGMVLRPNEEVIDARFFPFFIKSDAFLDEAIRISVGSLSPTVNWRDLRELRFNLPPIERQKELAGLLWAGEDLRSTYRRLLSACDEQVKSRFIEMFGDPFDPSDDCEVCRLGDRCEIITGNTPARAKKEYYGPGVDWIKSDNILPGAMQLERSKEQLTDSGKAVARLAQPGWLLMVCIAGSPNTIGNTALVDREVAYNQQINGINPRGENSLYLQTVLSLLKPRLTSGLNAALKCILNKSMLSAIEVPFPSREMQDDFASFVAQVDKSEFALKQAIEGVSATMAAILNQELGMSDVQ